MKTLSLVTQKGGASKSALARHLGVGFQQLGFDTVLLDTDAQGTLRDWGQKRTKPPLVEVELAPQRRYVETVVEKIRDRGVDVLIIDTPGSLESSFVSNAISLADFIVVPVRPTEEDLAAFWDLETKISDQRKSFNVVLSQCPTHTKRPLLDTLAALKRNNVPVAPVAIHMKMAIPISYVSGATVLEMTGLSTAEHRSVREFENLVAYLSRKLKLTRKP